jgi:aerobic-type carbon monoxide dehydrogenase small subunit (CoxS/CutS family)
MKIGRIMEQVELQVNGQRQVREVEDRTLLVEFLRQNLGIQSRRPSSPATACNAASARRA